MVLMVFIFYNLYFFILHKIKTFLICMENSSIKNPGSLPSDHGEQSHSHVTNKNLKIKY